MKQNNLSTTANSTSNGVEKEDGEGSRRKGEMRFDFWSDLILMIWVSSG
ncbi:hypothetical protein LINPERPRIM_LOCUS1075 [Linum perenne]